MSRPKIFDLKMGVTATNPSAWAGCRERMEKAAKEQLCRDLRARGYEPVLTCFVVAWSSPTTGKATIVGVPILGHHAHKVGG